MYLSKLILNPRSQHVRRDLADCQALHRRVLSAFRRVDAEGARASLGVLYRVETDERAGATTFLIQSAERPEWDGLPDHYLAPEEGVENPACKFIGEKYAAVAAGMVFRFRLRANPTRKIETKTGADGRKRNGKRVEIREEQKQVEWLERKGAQHGFRVHGVLTTDENKSVGNRGSRRAAVATDENMLPTGGEVDKKPRPPRLTFASVLFEGELMITDKESFVDALKGGVGSGKAYGFGLLSISR